MSKIILTKTYQTESESPLDSIDFPKKRLIPAKSVMTKYDSDSDDSDDEDGFDLDV